MDKKPTIYQFDDIRVDLENFKVFRADHALRLEPKAVRTLIFLIEHRGRLIEKSELLDAVWPDTFVTENAMTKVIAQLRKTLGDGIKEAKYIETVPTRGYRFIAQVEEGEGQEAQGQTEVNAEAGARSMPPPRSALESESSVRTGGKAARLTRRVKRVGWRVPLACALLVGLISTGYFWPRQSKVAVPGAPSTAIKSVAVLPFKPLVVGSRDESLEMGMADTLITRLGSIKEIVVRPVSAVRKYADLDQDPVAAGQALNVESVLEGSIQKSDDRIRVTVRLLNVSDGKSLWAEKYDEQFTDIFTIQDRVAEQVAESLKLTLTGEEKKLLAKHYTDDAEAYKLYLKGTYYRSKWTDDGFKKSVEQFEQAIERDPNYALAYAGLANTYIRLGLQGVIPPKDAYPKAKAAALKAVTIDDTLGEAHASLGFVKQLYDWDWPGARREYQRAIELDPNHAGTRYSYSYHFVHLGLLDKAITEIERVKELDPLSIEYMVGAADVYKNARRYDQAIEESRKALEMDSNYGQAYLFLGQAYEYKGMYDEAIAEYQKAISLMGNNPEIAASLGHAYAVSGRRDEARKVIKDLKELSNRRYVDPTYIAVVYAGLGEKDQAFNWLEKAFEDRSGLLVHAKVEPIFDDLRADPRFTDLLRRVGLVP